MRRPRRLDCRNSWRHIIQQLTFENDFRGFLLPKEQKKEAKEKCNFETIKIYVGRGDVNTLMAYMSLNSDSSTNRMILPSDDDVTNSKKKARIIRPLA